MPNYRGGEREMSRSGAELVKAIREGRTESQRRRNFGQKLVFAGVQAGLTGAGGLASAAKSNDLQRKQADANLRSSADKYKAAEYTGGTSDVPSWLGARGEGNADMLQPSGPKDNPYAPDIISAADSASKAQAANRAREFDPLGNFYSPNVAEKKHGEIDMMSRDLNTANQGMKQAEHVIYPGRGLSYPEDQTNRTTDSINEDYGDTGELRGMGMRRGEDVGGMMGSKRSR